MFDLLFRAIGAGIYVALFVVSWLVVFLVGLFASALFGATSLWWAVVAATLGSVVVTWFVYRLGDELSDGLIATFGNESAREKVLRARRERERERERKRDRREQDSSE